MPAPVVLVLEHERSAPVGWLGEWLTALGVTLDVRHCADGDEVPAVAAVGEHAGVVVLGGSMGARDDDVAPWLPTVRELVADAAARGVPVLGLCLGHQLATVALGGEVERRPDGQHIGVLPVTWTPPATADPLVGTTAAAAMAAGGTAADGTAAVGTAADGTAADGSGAWGTSPCVHWNGDVVTRLPEGGTLLATSGLGDVAVARLSPSVWGIQPHPEAGPVILADWADEDRDEARTRGVDVDHHVAQAATHRRALHDAWEPLGAAFARMCGVVVPR